MNKAILAIAVLFSISACNKDPKCVWEFDAKQRVISASALDDDRMIAVLTNNDIQIIDLRTGKAIKRIASGDYGYFPNGRSDLRSIACEDSICWVAGGSHYVGFLAKINTANNERNFIESDLFSEIWDVGIGPAHTIITGHGTELVTIWNAENLQRVNKIQLSDSREVYAVHYDGKNFLAGNDAGELVIWDGRTKIPMHRIIVEPGNDKSESQPSPIDTIATANGFFIVGGHEYLDLINSKAISDKRHVELKGATVSSCDSSTDSQVVWCGLTNGVLVSVGFDGEIKSSERVHDHEIRFVKALPGIVITASTDGMVRAQLNKPGSR